MTFRQARIKSNYDIRRLDRIVQKFFILSLKNQTFIKKYFGVLSISRCGITFDGSVKFDIINDFECKIDELLKEEKIKRMEIVI